MTTWRDALKSDPVPMLLQAKSDALRFFTRRDLLGERVGSITRLWESPDVERLTRRQLASGAWSYASPRTRLRSVDSYNLLETFRSLSELVEKHGLDKRHPSIQRASRYVLSRQSAEGDIRGIAGNQYLPYYTAAFLELLTKAGYASDRRVLRGFRWLLSIRQDDGGWAIPLRTTGRNFRAPVFRAPPIKGIPRKPSSHMVTGVVLRAFAAHPRYRRTADARAAGALLASRLFRADVYPDRRAADFWMHFSFPFWFTDLVSALDSLSLLGFPRDEPSIDRALRWLAGHQGRGGLWRLRMVRGTQEPELHAWLTLAVCRVLRRFSAARTTSASG